MLASRVILGSRPKVSPSEIFRLIFSGGEITKLPDKSEARHYLTTAQQSRLDALGKAHGEDYGRRSFLFAAFRLLSKDLRFTSDTIDDATDVVRIGLQPDRGPGRRASDELVCQRGGPAEE